MKDYIVPIVQDFGSYSKQKSNKFSIMLQSQFG